MACSCLQTPSKKRGEQEGDGSRGGCYGNHIKGKTHGEMLHLRIICHGKKGEQSIDIGCPTLDLKSKTHTTNKKNMRGKESYVNALLQIANI